MVVMLYSAELIQKMRADARSIFMAGLDADSDDNFLPAIRKEAQARYPTVLWHSEAGFHKTTDIACKLHTIARTWREAPAVALIFHRCRDGRRNNDVALKFGLLSETAPLTRPWVFLSGNTSLRGVTCNSAGAIVDSGSCQWIRQSGIDLDDSASDPSSALANSGDLLFVERKQRTPRNIDLILLEQQVF